MARLLNSHAPLPDVPVVFPTHNAKLQAIDMTESLSMDALKIDGDQARQMAQNGAAVLLLDVPVGTNFTIDYDTYR